MSTTAHTPPDATAAAELSGLDPESSGAELMARQRAILPPNWRAGDRQLVRATELVLFVVGMLFTAMITLEVISRYVFSFSIFFVNASARLLLVWFFMLGAGIALRRGAHVGFELFVSSLSPPRRRQVILAGYFLSLVFFAEMVWGGVYSIGPALTQTEAGLGISIVWFVLAIPVGFVLLAYHMLVLIVGELRPPQARADRR